MTRLRAEVRRITTIVREESQVTSTACDAPLKPLHSVNQIPQVVSHSNPVGVQLGSMQQIVHLMPPW